MLEYVALGILITMVIFVVYLVIYIHDIPYEIAVKRGHPHQDAIHIAGWVSLFLAHTIWPFIWIWSYLYKPGEKFLQMEVTGAGSEEQSERIGQLEKELNTLSNAHSEMKVTLSQMQNGESQNG